MKPVRIQLSRRKGFNLQAVSLALNGLPAVKVTRPGPWGNPFRVGGYFMVGDPDPRARFGMAWCEATPEYAKETGAFALVTSPMTAVTMFKKLADRGFFRDAPEKLRGKNLACFCPADQPCHADILLEIANSQPPGEKT